ncbi:MAG: hypothetical protein IT375_34970 [Polyangiaceae bacterium]|nr:hypothetical protein [Polyangiaceae bacterium]
MTMVDEASVWGADADRSDEVKTWDELMSGRWRIVELFDVEGRRHVVAQRRNGAPLSRLERQVLERRARGEALKVIAMDLGVSVATASRRLRAGMHKLGLGTLADLSRLMAR